MKKIILILTTLLLILILSLSLHKNKSQNTKVVVSEVTHSVFYAPWYAAIENGYFKDQNIDIEVLLTPGADKVATSVLSGDANIGFSGPEATVYIYNNSKQKLLTFASLTKKDGQFIVGPCDLKNKFKMSDLKGKTVLAGRSGGMPLLMFKYALKESNINENDIRYEISFDITLNLNSGKTFKAEEVNIAFPVENIISSGTEGKEITDLSNIIFKRIEN